jgi:hypothetical protein
VYHCNDAFYWQNAEQGDARRSLWLRRVCSCSLCSPICLATLPWQTGEKDVLIPLLIRGVGMALLFVPLTTLAMSDLKGAELGQGSGLNNMMRQLGGSFGIAVLTTLIHTRQAFTAAICLRI